MKKNNGFTLVELLATITILGILMIVAVPNVIGIVNRNKNKTYIEDAKKLATLAEYEYRKNPSYPNLKDGSCIKMSMKFLGTSEFDNSPYGGKYNFNESFVKVVIKDNSYKYFVYLQEDLPNSGGKKGVRFIDSSALFDDDSIRYVRSNNELTKGENFTNEEVICSINK